MTNPDPTVKKVSAATQGRYLLRLPNTEGPHPLLIGFHGYGENADVHLRQLERIPGIAAWLVVSVQALHWFYDRTHQHVVASWMTKLCREQAIADNLRYIDRVVEEILEHHNTNGCMVFEGFSQGASMAYRVASAIRHQSDGLIVLAGDIPPELRQAGSLDLPPTLIGRGVHDEWFTQERYNADLSFLTSCGVTVESVVFDGGHAWTDEFRSAAGNLLASHIQPA